MAGKAKAKGKGGAPTKYGEKTARQAGRLCSEHGYTDQQLADFFEVTRTTINNWKKRYSEFFTTLKDSKSTADDRVERALYERAIGYSCPEDKIFNNNGEPLVVPTVKHYPPDTGACFIWLQNRRPDEWKQNPKPKDDRDVGPIEVKVTVARPAPEDTPPEYLEKE